MGLPTIFAKEIYIRLTERERPQLCAQLDMVGYVGARPNFLSKDMSLVLRTNVRRSNNGQLAA